MTPNDVDRLLNADVPGRLMFQGGELAAAFGREVEESMRGVLQHNYRRTMEPFMPGYVTASMDGWPWGKEMWTRDVGTLLRELALFGWFNHGGITCECLIKLATKNKKGFYTFPTLFTGVEPKSGDELDGTCAIIIGMMLLWRGWPAGSPFRASVEEFLFCDASPLRYMHELLLKKPLLPGEGEFGGGNVPGLFYNVVQNNLARYALIAAARFAGPLGRAEEAREWSEDAQKLGENIRQLLIGKDGGWLWAIDPKTKTMTKKLDNAENKNHGGHNGPACMYADVLGLTPLEDAPDMAPAMLQTFDTIYNSPNRKELFDAAGFWSQFEEPWDDVWLTGAYGQGYALQCMLLFDKLEMADKALRFYTEATVAPPDDSTVLKRESPYHFFERYWLVPRSMRNPDLDPGCGPLNLVSVTEPVKAARLIMGLDDISTPGEVKLVPRLTSSVTGYAARNWPIHTPDGIVHANIDVMKTIQGFGVRFSVLDGRVPRLRIRFGSAATRYVWQQWSNVTRMEVRG